MKTQSKENQWVWIFGLIFAALLAAVTLAADRPDRAARTERSAPAARTESRPTQAAAARPASQPEPATITRTATPSPAPAARPESRPTITSSQTRVWAAAPAAPTPAAQIQRQTAPQSRPVERTVVSASTRQPTPVYASQPAAATQAARPTVTERTPATRESVTTTIRPNTANAQTDRIISADAVTRPAETRPAQERVTRDTVVQTIGDRPTARAADTERVTRATTQERTEGFTYRGSAWYERSARTDDTAAAERSDASKTLRQRTVEPLRVTTDDIKSQPQRITVDQIERRPERVSRAETTASASVSPDNGRTLSERVTRKISTEDAAPQAAASDARTRDSLARTARSDDAGRSEGSRDARPRTSNDTDTRSAASSTFRQADAARPSPRHSEVTRSADSARTSPRPRPSQDHSSQIVINGSNNVIVQGSVTAAHPRPYIHPRHVTNITYIRTSPYWVSHGSSFVFHWSSLSCGRVAVVPCHDWYGVTYYYPSYHRKYVFVSLGGYWPSYRYVRYYWYGAHPYYWYGPYVISSAPYEANTYNTYNTYNSYSTYSTPAPTAAATAYSTGGAYQYNPAADDFSDVRQRLEAEKNAVDTPEFETAADLSFANAVKLFEAGNYDDAVLQFRESVRLAPDDAVLPFTYTQALFAAGDYAMAASVLREAMVTISAEEPTVYYPRGLYADETVLRAQIAALEKAAAAEPFGADYQLLLGYQYLGLGELDKAAAPLTAAARNAANTDAAGKLLDLAAKLEQAKD